MKKKAMSAQFVEITLEEMDKFLKRGFRALRPTKGTTRGEVHYNLKLSPHVGIRVLTSIKPHSGVGADVGADAIRVQLISLKDDGPLERGKAPIVKRTQGWRNSLQDRIEELVEKYEDREEYWDTWASTRGKKTPQPVPSRENLSVREDGTEESVDDTPAQAPHRPLHGGITEPQLKYLGFLIRNVSDITWGNLGLDEITGFSSVPSRDQLRSLSKMQASRTIDKLKNLGSSRRYASQETLPGFDDK